MAFCAYCGREISPEAPACPNCGHPNEMRAPRASVALAGIYAGFWRRFGALLLDGVILSLVTYPFRLGDRSFAYYYFSSTLVTFLYRWLMLAFANGQTLGKKALRIRIANPDRSPISVSQAATREGMAIVSGLAFAVGYLWAAWDPERRTWHDMAANTRAFLI